MPPRFNLAINVAPEEPMAGNSGGGGGGKHLEVGLAACHTRTWRSFLCPMQLNSKADSPSPNMVYAGVPEGWA